MPADWTKGVIIRIPKKGASKTLAKFIIKQISDAVDTGMRKEQVGFRKERGFSGQIFTLCNIIGQCTDWQRQLYINFVNFEKAFDSIHRDSLWHILRVDGIPLDIVQIIKNFYHNFTCSMGSSSLNFQVKTGYIRDLSYLQSFLTW